VLVPLVRRADRDVLVFTLRRDDLPAHAVGTSNERTLRSRRKAG